MQWTWYFEGNIWKGAIHSITISDSLSDGGLVYSMEKRKRITLAQAGELCPRRVEVNQLPLHKGLLVVNARR
jgi:hypothetical protein